jgi:hypothetical protein
MGDWRQNRKGLTKNERGIPTTIFEKIFLDNKIEIISKSYCFTMTSFLQVSFGKLFSKPIIAYKIYVLFDKIISAIFKSNTRYHATKKLQRISPQNIFYILKKK